MIEINSGKNNTILPDTLADQTASLHLNVKTSSSLIHIGSLDSFDITKGGVEAAGKILEYLETGSNEVLESAINIYNHIIPNENFGGEYTALLWLCKLFLANQDDRRDFLSYAMVESWYELLSKNKFHYLKEYLNHKYHYIEIERDDPEAKVNLRFLEDFILFNNPDRERWDKTSDNIKSLNLKEGDKVIDLGSGPGYFTFKFADLVGKSGHVYAIETNEKHLNYLKEYIEKYGISNVDVVEYKTDGSSMKKLNKADLIYMCSLYHVIYAAYTDGERDLFIEGIKSCLKEDGRFVIIDNDLVEGEELPYHGPYISRELIISQLWHYGFKLSEQYQFSPQRYVLEFTLNGEEYRKVKFVQTPAILNEDDSSITVTSTSSLVRYRMIGTSSQGYTLYGKKAARLLYSALHKMNEDTIKAAQKAYLDLIPKERIGDEYTAFEWICRYLLASQEKKVKMTSYTFDEEYIERLGGNDFEFLKKYIRIKYDLVKPDPEELTEDEMVDDNRVHEIIYEYDGKEVSFDQLNDWNEFVSFNNPNRERWEKTGEMLEYLNIREGETVADVGCGYGFFTFKFSQMVGKAGRIYSTEINKDALEYVKGMKEKHGLNIEVLEAKLNDACLPTDSIDTIFLCSMYHAVYIASIEFVKDQFIESLKKALKSGGRLVVVDNAITPSSEIPYFGSGIAKELVISQLKHYGFRLQESKQFIPQRYILIFKKDC